MPFVFKIQKLSMNVYQHIAENNANEANALCTQYGYTCMDVYEGADALEEIANSGDEGFKDVMNLHPEKEVIIALFTEEKKPAQFLNFAANNTPNNCSGCSNNRNSRTNYNNAAGDNTSNSGLITANLISMQTNTLLTMGIIVLAVAAVYIGSK